MKRLVFVPCFIFMSFFYAFGQSLPQPSYPEKQRQQAEAESRRQAQTLDVQKQFDDLGRLSETMINTPNERLPDNTTPPRLIETELKKEQKERLMPTPLDLNASAAFLKQPNTGIIKLFPDIGCQDNPGVLRADEKCLDWIPNSASYSFRKRKYNWDFISDIRYKDGFFLSDSALTQGIFTSLGNINLEDVSLDQGEIKFLTDFKPETDGEAAAKQFIKMREGIKAGNYIYCNTWKALENTTYALRVIAYHGSFYSKFRGQPLDVLYGDKRSDILITFRVIRKDLDGGIILLWKELSRRDSPKIILSKKKETISKD